MKDKSIDDGTIYATPVKSFFVEMFTRDIELVDAILDLLDNCVDGILRQKSGEGIQPYKGYFAEISFSEKSFEILDNCGGIPKEASRYAFRMGRIDKKQDEGIHTVGTYGIGMKRALFKIGAHSIITTKTNNDAYKIEILPEWLRDEENWALKREPVNANILESTGTRIYITKLKNEIALRFGKGKEKFATDLSDTVKTHYSIILQKGFTVIVNGVKIKPDIMELLCAEPENVKSKKELLRPYIYRGEMNGVEIFLAVGFTGPPPSREDLDSDQEKIKYKSERAGWTIICNDRIVVSYDKTRLTGWGDAGVPNYHTQFIAVAGFVEFKSKNARNLPITTTKRGVDASSDVYLAVKNRMQEGMKQFTQFTNQWKGKEKEAKEIFISAQKISPAEIKDFSNRIKMTDVRRDPQGQQLKPILPMPQEKKEKKKISFVRPTREIRMVAKYLFDDPDQKPSVIGEKCFEIVLEDAKI